MTSSVSSAKTAAETAFKMSFSHACADTFVCTACMAAITNTSIVSWSGSSGILHLLLGMPTFTRKSASEYFCSLALIEDELHHSTTPFPAWGESRPRHEPHVLAATFA
jgi:hypothetical protein